MVADDEQKKRILFSNLVTISSTCSIYYEQHATKAYAADRRPQPFQDHGFGRRHQKILEKVGSFILQHSSWQ